MTARSKSRRQANRKLKSEKSKAKELKRLQKLMSGKDLMEVCSEVVDEKKLEEIKQKKLEETLREEFIEEQIEKLEEATTSNSKKSKKRKGKKMKVVNQNTGKLHEFDVRTLKDQYGSYPPWLNVGNHKRKIKKRKTAIRKNQFYTGSIL